MVLTLQRRTKCGNSIRYTNSGHHRHCFINSCRFLLLVASYSLSSFSSAAMAWMIPKSTKLLSLKRVFPPFNDDITTVHYMSKKPLIDTHVSKFADLFQQSERVAVDKTMLIDRFWKHQHSIGFILTGASNHIANTGSRCCSEATNFRIRRTTRNANSNSTANRNKSQ